MRMRMNARTNLHVAPPTLLVSALASTIDEGEMSATEDPGVAGLCCCRRLSEYVYSSRHVAEELCLVDSELLRKIDPNELQNGAWMKKEKVDGGSEGTMMGVGGGGGGGGE